MPPGNSEEGVMDYFWFFLGLGLVITAIGFIKVSSLTD